MKYLVYAMVDPRTLLVRYVGKSFVRQCGKLRKLLFTCHFLT